MVDYEQYIYALRKCAKEHESERTSYGQIIVSDLCRDTANLLEELKREPTIDKVRAEIEKQEKWLLQAGYNQYNVDIAFSTIKSLLAGDDLTNGDIIKAMFPNTQIDYHEKSDLVDDYVTVFIKGCDTCQDYSYDWWNAPYKAGSEKK